MGLTHRSVGTHAAAFGGTRRAGERIVALAGNPNVGKSTVFNALTGMRQHTGNWAGKTVGCACGRCRSAREQYLFVDLPGTYSLQPHSAEEAVACDFVRGGKADAVVVVCDATCLERTLVLALQMHSVTPNTIVCVNLLDEARHKRIRIDLPALQAQLGMPVVGVTARKKKTLRALLDALDAVMAAPQPRPDGAPEAGDPADDVRRAEVICRAAVRRETPEYAVRDRRLDRLLTSRATGYPIMLLGLAAFVMDTVGGVLFAKLMNVFLPEGKKINPMIGAAGISAFPMSARVVQKMALKEDNQNHLLMHAIGANVSGQIGSVIAGGILLYLVPLFL